MTDIKKVILDKIVEYDSIVIGRHFRPDGDAIGSTKGLKNIIENTFPEKKVYLANSDYSSYLSFLGGDDGEVDESIISSSLVIILDTATFDRVSYKSLSKGKEIIKIDHHIKVENWEGTIEWIEDERSSTCEMIASFYSTFKDRLKLDTFGATCIYCGLVTDSLRFSVSSVTPETLRMAALMLEKGVDIENLQARLDLKDISFYRFRAAVFEKINITENGLAWIFVDSDMQKKFNLTREEASETVSFMSSIKDVLCWIAFIEMEDKIRVRIRSRFMTVNEIANHYHGGGHDRASGATCFSKEEMEALIKEADRSVKEYKEKNEDWM